MTTIALAEERALITNSKQLAWFCRDHYDGLMVVCKIRRAIRCKLSCTELRDLINEEFTKTIEPQFIKEETTLLPMLAAKSVFRIHAETQHAMLRNIVSSLAMHRVYKMAEEFANQLEDHIRFEERTLFPHLKQTLDRRMKEASRVCVGYFGVC